MTRVERPLLESVREPYSTGLVVTEDAPECRIAAFFDESAGAVAIGDTVRLHVTYGEQPFPYFRRDAAS
ncbi:hypothetical protein [Novosphingobium marinum]|uniref:DUF35 domain-containing protein n=1 Tax=Novosphingobium marinum TaxID=1514948 RepID=A0A7Y9XVU0_9SPHN|nr:hypothetical protein [Novosphingobium marinum]NYH95499.1 hypothetical protein [Novosphingobium marinum]